jgi:hypothetical protein
VEIGTRYLRHLENAGRKPVTLQAVRGHLEHWHEPFFAGKTLDAIRPEDLADLIALMRDGQRPGGLNRAKPLLPKTIRNVIGTLNTRYRHAIRHGWAVANPVAAVDLPAVAPADEIRFLEPVEVEAVAAAAITGPWSSSPWARAALNNRSSSPATLSAIGTLRLDRLDCGVPYPSPGLRESWLRRTRRRPAGQSTSHVAGVDGAPRHRHDAAVRGLRPSPEHERDLIAAAFGQTDPATSVAIVASKGSTA